MRSFKPSMVNAFRNIIKKQSKAFWAFLSSASAASSTLVYLWLIHGRSDRNEFLYLYSTIGMWSGWLNTAICYLAPTRRSLCTRSTALLLYAISVLATAVAPLTLFGLVPTLETVGFSATLLIPILYINTFSLRFVAGDYKYVYFRNLAFNAAFLFAAIVAAVFPNHLEGLYKTTAFLAPFGFIFWITDTSKSLRNGVVNHAPPVYARVLLNPVMPIFERLIWDQTVLAQLGFPSLTFYIYAASRTISFTGTVAMTYFLSHSLENGGVRLPRGWSGIWVAFGGLLFLQLLIPTQWQVETTFLSSQLCGWLLSVSFMLHLREKGNFYNMLLGVWACDFLARLCGMYLGNMKTYSHIAIGSSFAICIIMLVSYALRSKFTSLSGYAKPSRPRLVVPETDAAS